MTPSTARGAPDQWLFNPLIYALTFTNATLQSYAVSSDRGDSIVCTLTVCFIPALHISLRLLSGIASTREYQSRVLVADNWVLALWC